MLNILLCLCYHIGIIFIIFILFIIYLKTVIPVDKTGLGKHHGFGLL